MRGRRKVCHVSQTIATPHSFLFKASFANGVVETEIMADQGADANIVSWQLWDKIQKKMRNTRATILNPEQTHREVTGDPCLTCNKEVGQDRFLKVRLCSSIILRNMKWRVSKEDIAVSVVERTVLKSLDYDNGEMLVAARDIYGEDIDVTNRLTNGGTEEESNGRIAELYDEFVFQSHVSMEEEGITAEDIYVHFRDDEPRDVEK